MFALPEPLPSLAVHYFRLYWGYAGVRILFLVALTLVMTYAEGIGIALFFAVCGGSGNGARSGFSCTIGRLFDAVGVPLVAANVLPVIAGLFVRKGLLPFVTFRYQFELARRVAKQLRRRALSALATADYQHVASANAGFYTNLLVTEVNRAAGGFQYFVRSMSPAISAGTLFVMVCFFDWRLSLVCVLMGAVMIGLTRVSGFVIRRYSLAVTKESSTLTSLIFQLLHGFKYLRSTRAYERSDRRSKPTSERPPEP